jgi:hypothetical protein
VSSRTVRRWIDSRALSATEKEKSCASPRRTWRSSCRHCGTCEPCPPLSIIVLISQCFMMNRDYFI